MGKKLFSLCMALALCLGLLPATALAAGAQSGQTIYVGGKEVTSGGYWTTDSEGNVTSAGEIKPSDNYIYYDGNGTLTLHNATIKEEVPLNTSTYVVGAAIGVINQSGDAGLTITLEGTNTIAEVGKGIYVLANSTGGATLTITGDGSLDASASQTGIWVQSNNGNGALFIQNAKVEATGTNTAGYGVNVQSSNSSTAALTVDGGSLTASGSPGILYDSIGSGTVPKTTALTISNSAIVDARGGGIGAGSTTDLTEVSPTDISVGIVFGHDRSDSKAGTVYGSVTLQDNLEIGEGESMTIPDGAGLTIDSGATLTNKGTVTTTDGGTLTNNGKIENSGTLPDNIDGTAPPSITTLSLDGGTVGAAYNATLEASGTGTITWSNSGDLPAGLTLSESTGVISGTPTAQGTSDFTVTATNDYGSDSKEFTLTIDQQGTIHVTSVSLDKTSLELTEGETAQLTATVTPEGATNKNVTWSTSDASIATVDANGLVTAVSAGTATITVTTVDGGKTDTCTVTVREEAPDRPVNLPDTHSIDLIVSDGGKAKLSLTNASEGSTITVTATPDDGYELDYITVDGERIDGTTFKMPGHDVTVRVYFTDGAALPFTDVSAGAWYFDAVGYVYVGGLMDGVSDTLFDPDGTMTRAMVWAILARVDGETVTGDGWIETARDWAVAEGVSDGENATDYVTREQFATMLWRYAGEPETDGSGVGVFDDGETVSIWAFDAMSWALNNGVITGVSDDALLPANTATRAQCAAMLMRFVETNS